MSKKSQSSINGVEVGTNRTLNRSTSDRNKMEDDEKIETLFQNAC